MGNDEVVLRGGRMATKKRKRGRLPFYGSRRGAGWFQPCSICGETPFTTDSGLNRIKYDDHRARQKYVRSHRPKKRYMVYLDTSQKFRVRKRVYVCEGCAKLSESDTLKDYKALVAKMLTHIVFTERFAVHQLAHSLRDEMERNDRLLESASALVGRKLKQKVPRRRRRTKRRARAKK